VKKKRKCLPLFASATWKSKAATCSGTASQKRAIENIPVIFGEDREKGSSARGGKEKIATGSAISGKGGRAARGGSSSKWLKEKGRLLSKRWMSAGEGAYCGEGSKGRLPGRKKNLKSLRYQCSPESERRTRR